MSRSKPRGSCGKLVLMLSLLLPSVLICSTATVAQTAGPRFKVIAIAEAGGIHKPFVDAAKLWLGKLAAAENFSVDYIQDTNRIDEPVSLAVPGVHPTELPSLRLDSKGRGGVHQVY